MAGVDAHERALANLLAHAQRLAPVLDIGVVEGRLVELVLEEQACAFGQGGMDLAQAVDQAPPASPKIVLARIVGAVGEPDFDHARARLAGDLAAVEDMRDGLLAHLEGRMAQRAELVVLILEGVRVDAADLDAALARERGQG